MYKAIFLDKDGTLVDNSGYPEIIPKDKLLEENILDGLRYMQEKEYKIFIFSNQSWIAKNMMSKYEVEQVFQNVVKKLKKQGIVIYNYFYCPHQKSDNCDCRKPKNKLILEAAKKHNLDLTKSYIVGDSDVDILAGKHSNMKTILVLTGRGKEFKDSVQADYVINDLNAIKEVLWL